MAKVISKKIKIGIVVVASALIGGGSLLYQKFFGGKIQNIPQGKFVIGEPQRQPEQVREEKKQEKVAVAYAETPALGIQEVVARTGDFDFIKPGQKVLVKPNVNSDDPSPGTTHHEALAEVVRLAKAKGAYVIVGDRSNPMFGTISAMKKTGMYEAAKKAGADEILGFEDGEWMRVKPEGAKNWTAGFRVPKLLSEVDHVISLPVLHTHSMTGYSLALKNLVGLIHPADRMIFHASSKTQEMIAEISLAVKPSITIIDGTKAFISGGPMKGTAANTKVYLASKDVLMAEVFGVELLRKHGADLDSPWESDQVKRALELGLGFEREEIEEELKKKS